ncbi:hypothetical protein MRB53_036940 [Persea americana]|nr:hypothetical protein MRB53_036940 [Persea americana]
MRHFLVCNGDSMWRTCRHRLRRALTIEGCLENRKQLEVHEYSRLPTRRHRHAVNGHALAVDCLKFLLRSRHQDPGLQNPLACSAFEVTSATFGQSDAALMPRQGATSAGFAQHRLAQNPAAMTLSQCRIGGLSEDVSASTIKLYQHRKTSCIPDWAMLSRSA